MTNVKDPAFDANPTFQVVSIKPSAPDETQWSMQIRGHHFVTTHANLNDLICYAYGLHVKQIANAPEWFNKERFDVDALPNTEALPTRDQFHEMVRKMLADRFQMKSHHEEKALSLFVIEVAKSGVKIAENEPLPDAATGYGVDAGVLRVKNYTIAAVASVLQRTITDRPVVDRTGLGGRYTFVLKWNPDETQFAQLKDAATLDKEGTDTEERSSLAKAMQEQLGLELRAKKAMSDALVIDNAKRPTVN